MRRSLQGSWMLGRASLAQWLRRRDTVHRRWLGGVTVWVAWLALVLAALSPPHGSGIPLCWFQASTGVQCVGCGLTRSLSCGLRGMFAESIVYHPMGLPVLCVFLTIVGASLLPKHLKVRLRSCVQANAGVFNTLYLALVVSFVGYGLVRSLLQLPIF